MTKRAATKKLVKSVSTKQLVNAVAARVITESDGFLKGKKILKRTPKADRVSALLFGMIIGADATARHWAGRNPASAFAYAYAPKVGARLRKIRRAAA